MKNVITSNPNISHTLHTVLGVDEWLVSAVMSMHMSARTVVRTVHGNGDNFEGKVGMHQGSALSPLLFCDNDGGYMIHRV